MRILTYNIKAGLGMDGQRSIERIADVIKGTGADVVCLQEVDRRNPRSGLVDQPKRLSEVLGMQAVFQRNLTFGFGGFGNLVLSRYPVVRSVSHRLTSQTEQRGLLEVLLDTSSGSLSVFCTHLGLDSEERVQQSAEIAGVINSTDYPAVLCGDFNETDSSPAVAGLAASANLQDLAGSLGADAPTFPADAPTSRIDFIFATPRIRCTCAAVIESLASDHLPVLADIDILP